jgi:uncharacterized membrane protein
MAHAENSVTIQRPASVVFAFLLDGKKNPLWRPDVLSITKEPGSPDGLGAIYRQRLKGPGGRPIAGDYEITECQPASALAFRVIAGPARPTGTYRLSEQDGATTLHFTLDYPPAGFMGWLMDGMIASTMRGEVARLADLKAYLESQPA